MAGFITFVRLSNSADRFLYAVISFFVKDLPERKSSQTVFMKKLSKFSHLHTSPTQVDTGLEAGQPARQEFIRRRVYPGCRANPACTDRATLSAIVYFEYIEFAPVSLKNYVCTTPGKSPILVQLCSNVNT